MENDKGDERRKGDERSSVHEPGVRLTFLPAKGQPFRWLPRHGDPLCVGEWLSQTSVRALAYVPVYTAIVTTLTLLVLVAIWGKL